MVRRRDDTAEAINSILRLRHAETRVEPALRPEIRSAREFLERLVGPTVRPAEAARLLGVSHPALNRWIDRGEIATVLTPQGRREIPLPELVQLLEDLEQIGNHGGSRRLASVIGERRRRATETVDLDRLLPRRRSRSHRPAELQALAYHRLVAERLDDEIVGDARRRLAQWRQSGRIDPRWASEWEKILAMPSTQVARAISADTVRGRELRQTSPFAGVLSEQERRRLVEAVEQRARA